MLKSGLVSISFRALAPDAVATLAARAGLRAIEWGGDIHVPAGDEAAARKARRLTRDAGLAVSAYGSYFRAGDYAHPQEECDRIVRSAAALESPLIRIWAGSLASAAADGDARARVEEQSAMLCEQAARQSMRVAWEYHGNTLTDTLDSTRSLLRAVPGMLCYWQPPVDSAVQENLEAIAALRGRLANVHVFQWAGHDRLPLEEGAECWARYFAAVRQANEPDSHESGRFASLEFVRGDDPEQLVRDAHTLDRLLNGAF